MGKGTDKLYITHSEWASGDAFSASAGSGLSKPNVPGANFRRLPFNFCAVSLQPFQHPVCTASGTTFDLINILPWIKKHGTNPVDGSPLKSSELIKLNFAKNDDAEYVDPVTFKPFTDNSHIVALRNSGNVFAWDTIERLNIKAKNWHDLVSETEFTRKDIITLQDPEHLGSRDLSTFQYIKEGTSTLTDAQIQERQDPTNSINTSSLGSAAKILKAKEAVAKARAERANGGNGATKSSTDLARTAANGNGFAKPMAPKSNLPYNAAMHTTGRAAASFTSTGLTPHTSAERALLTDEEYMLKPRRVKTRGYARVTTTQGALTFELNTEYAPKAVWNFLQLCKRGHYRGVSFHRSIRNFMIQGGDPTGTGRGGQSVWGKPFADEYAQSPLKHNARGVLSMANKGKNTNTSQFFITYRAASHLDLKHTIFGKVVEDEGGEGMATLSRLENVKTGEGDKPLEECKIEEVVVLLDPFEEFLKNKDEKDLAEKAEVEVQRQGGTEDDNTTWTGKKIRGSSAGNGTSDGVGKYLAVVGDGKTSVPVQEEDEIVEEWDMPEEPQPKKRKTGGFGNFDGW